MNKIFFIILIVLVISSVILYIKPNEQFTNTNFNNLNNIPSPDVLIHPFHYDTQLADSKCLYQSTKNFHDTNISQKINHNIINENIINEKNNCCNIIEKQQLKLNKNPYDFRFHRSNNSKGLYKNSVSIGSQ